MAAAASSPETPDARWLEARLGPREFKRLSAVIEGQTGIRMPATRRTMLEGRLRHRLKALRLGDFETYCQRVLDSGDAEEVRHLIDRATTNTTQFFREPAHFNYLARQVLPALQREGRFDGRPLSVWSAGCSTGEEVYTLAMVLDEAAATQANRGGHRIRGTDISVDVLRVAARAVYPADRADTVPRQYRARYLLSSRSRAAPSIRVVPALRRVTSFDYLNLMDPAYKVDAPVDILFCRNVFIYFNRDTQHEVLDRFLRCMEVGAHLFLGHVDTVHGFDLPLAQVAPSVYRKIPRGGA